MYCRLTRFLLKVGAIEPLCYPFQIRTTNNGDSIGPNFPKGVVSENVLLSEPLRLPDLKTAPDFPKGLRRKRCYPTAVVSVANTNNKQGRLDSINFSEGCRFRKLGAVEPLRFPKMRSAESGSIAPNLYRA